MERGPHGEPSRLDFELYELPRLFRDIATGWQSYFEPIPGRPDYRVFISVGVLVRALSVDLQLAQDGAIEMTSLSIEMRTESSVEGEEPVD